MDQHEDSTLSHVTSGLSFRYWMRMIEIAQVYIALSAASNSPSD